MKLKASFSVGNLRLLLLFEVTDWAITAQEGWRYVRMNLQIATGWKSVLWRRPPVVTLYFPPDNTFPSTETQFMRHRRHLTRRDHSLSSPYLPWTTQ